MASTARGSGSRSRSRRSSGFKSKRDIEAFGIAEFVERCKERVLQVRQHPDRAVDPARLLDGLGQLVLHDVRREQLHDLALPEELPRARLDLQGPRRHALVPALRHRHLRARDRTRATRSAPTARSTSSSRWIDEDASLLVWTTTPWTLPANVAAAVHPELTYLKVRAGRPRLLSRQGRRAARAQGRVRGRSRRSRAQIWSAGPTAGRSTSCRRMQVSSTASSPGTMSRRRRHRHRPHRARLRQGGLRALEGARPAGHRADRRVRRLSSTGSTG